MEYIPSNELKVGTDPMNGWHQRYKWNSFAAAPDRNLGWGAFLRTENMHKSNYSNTILLRAPKNHDYNHPCLRASMNLVHIGKKREKTFNILNLFPLRISPRFSHCAPIHFLFHLQMVLYIYTHNGSGKPLV